MRRTLFKLHRWFGIAALVLLLVQALSGLLLVFHWELAQRLDPAGMRQQATGSVTLDQVFAAAQQALPGDMIDRITYPRVPKGTYLAQAIRADGSFSYASIDPGDARVLRSGGIGAFPMEVATRLHFYLLAGGAGLAVVLAGGLALTLLAASGLVIWWPTRNGWSRAFRVQWSAPSRRLVPNLHRVFGAGGAILFLWVGVTGVLLAGEPLLSGAAMAPPYRVQVVEHGLNAAFDAAMRAMPGHEVHDVRLGKPGALYVLLRAPEMGPRAVHILEVGLADATVRGTLRAGERANIAFYALPLHTGEDFGTAGLVLELATGLLLLLVSVAGVTTWAQRRLARRANRGKAAAARAADPSLSDLRVQILPDR